MGGIFLITPRVPAYTVIIEQDKLWEESGSNVK